VVIPFRHHPLGEFVDLLLKFTSSYEVPQNYVDWFLYHNHEKMINKALELGFKPVLEPIRPGDLYLGSFNTDNLLECKAVSPNGYIIATTLDYAYDWHNCIKVKDEQSNNEN
jgi:hypothetical protein